MKCCRKELESPEIIDGTAYFVCPECGDLYEVKNYRVYSTDEAFNYFKEKYGFNLPKEYISLQEVEHGSTFKLPPSNSQCIQYYFGEDFYVTGDIAKVDPNADYSIYDSANSGWEWGVPDYCIAIEGDGHTWLALDYSASSKSPSVVVIETDDNNSLTVATSFSDFVSALLPYEDVYDIDGNIIYNKKST
ncbi:SMI1/KNR4 family protein [Bacterioplanoides sp.]|uniref:SMI1/KNR4 family protein n=1 Tax=Bacterioplanoides sp. TaxID=2066072 RepID=UPI003AFFBCE0